MSLRDFILRSPALHLVTNSLLGNLRPVFGGMRQNHVAGWLASLCALTRLHIQGHDNRVILGRGGYLLKSHIRIIGHHNTIRLGEGVRLWSTFLWIHANNADITLAGGNLMHHCELGVEGDGGQILLGKDVLVGGFLWLNGCESGSQPTRLYVASERLTIGAGSIVSDGVTMRTHDSHPIFDDTGAVINTPADITVGAHCWVAPEAMILKGGAMGDGSILGTRAMLTQDLRAQERVILVGSPARVVRRGIAWHL
jgi:acetyltransferase-like isoleucine patch superfamily enzyme